MKRVILIAVVLMFGAGLANADTLAVNNTAALGGTGTACGGGNCGLEVSHDNTSVAYVEDLTPDGETVYRMTFLFNPASTTTSSNVRQTIFRGIGPNPNPGVGNCHPTLQTASSFRLFYYRTGGSGQNASILAFVNGNQCGERSIPARIPLTVDDPVRICAEMTTGNSLSGTLAVAIVDDQASCPSTGDPAYGVAIVSNGLLSVDRIRMGTPQTNNFGAGETMTLYFDEFESFRTLAP